MVDTSADIIEKVKETKTAFFTPVIAHEIFYKLVNDYFILNENDLNAWDADPEAYGWYRMYTCNIIFFFLI